MPKDNREILRPEDATSWEEFQARYIAETLRENEPFRSNRRYLWLLPTTAFLMVEIISWIEVFKAPSPGRWIALVFALVFIWPTFWAAAKSPSRVTPSTSRTRELDAIHDEWKARAERGEIPQTSPGGVKVWQDQ